MIKIDSEETFGSGQVTGTEFTFQLEITKKKNKKPNNIGNNGSQNIGHQSRKNSNPREKGNK